MILGNQAARSYLSIMAVFLTLVFAFTSCGEAAKNGGQEAGQSSLDLAKQKLKDAGSDVQEIYVVRNWINEKVKANDPSKIDLQLLAGEAETDIVQKFGTLVSRLDSSKAAVATKLRDWAEGVVAKEKDPETGKLSSFGRQLSSKMAYLWEIASKSDPNNADLRRKLGSIEHTKDLNSYLDLPYIDEDRDIKHITDLIEAVAEDHIKSPDGKKWLAKDFKKMKEYVGIDEWIGKRKAALDEKLKDPFFADAYRVLGETIEFLKKKKNLKSYRWVGRIHHPYLFVIERDSGWDETDVAKNKAKQLQELINLFHGEYADTFKLKEITKPLPIIVFKRASAYRQYAVGKTLAGALGHFEHGSDRIVLSDQVQRDTMFHEGTHQLITYHTQVDTIANFLTRSYWFQEGVAEYFGGTASYVDKGTGNLRYRLGVLQGGRINGWRGNEEQAHTLWDLIGLTFADRQANIASGKTQKNLMVYAQGWLLVYFLYNFNVDSEDMVQLSDTPVGKYKQGFLNYMKGELEGKTGRDFFLQCIGLWDKASDSVDKVKWNRFNREYVRYYNWINRKMAMKHVENREIIAWDKIKRKGRLIGDKEDDQLPEEDIVDTFPEAGR